MLIAVGDDEIDSIKFPNGWSINIEFGIDEYGPWVGEVELRESIVEYGYMIKNSLNQNPLQCVVVMNQNILDHNKDFFLQ